MVIYEVNLDVSRKIQAEFSMWLDHHVQQMLELPGFVDAAWYERRDDSSDDTVCWTTQYRLGSRAELDEYLATHAAAMRADGQDRFGDQFTASRRILVLVEEYP